MSNKKLISTNTKSDLGGLGLMEIPTHNRLSTVTGRRGRGNISLQNILLPVPNTPEK